MDYAGPAKTDEQGNVSYVFPSQPGGFAFGSGKWTIVVEQLGPGKTVVHRGTASFVITGGAVGVAGAKLWVSPDALQKGESFVIYGSGFAPWEIVSLWIENPNGECSTFAYNTGLGFNDVFLDGVSTFTFGDVKADASGEIAASGGSFDSANCSGTYHLVARGNASWRGGETWITVTGHAVTESAYLQANEHPVYALFGSLSFSGWGYAAGEHVTCWTTDPQGRAVWLGEARADSGGKFTLNWYTGAYVPGFPIASAGPLGEWAATCRGDSSGATGIARYTIVGNPVVDP